MAEEGPVPGKTTRVIWQEDPALGRRTVRQRWLGPAIGWKIEATGKWEKLAPEEQVTPVFVTGAIPGVGIKEVDFEREARIEARIRAGLEEGLIVTPTGAVQARRISPTEVEVIETKRGRVEEVVKEVPELVAVTVKPPEELPPEEEVAPPPEFLAGVPRITRVAAAPRLPGVRFATGFIAAGEEALRGFFSVVPETAFFLGQLARRVTVEREPVLGVGAAVLAGTIGSVLQTAEDVLVAPTTLFKPTVTEAERAETEARFRRVGKTVGEAVGATIATGIVRRVPIALEQVTTKPFKVERLAVLPPPPPPRPVPKFYIDGQVSPPPPPPMSVPKVYIEQVSPVAAPFCAQFIPALKQVVKPKPIVTAESALAISRGLRQAAAPEALRIPSAVAAGLAFLPTEVVGVRPGVRPRLEPRARLEQVTRQVTQEVIAPAEVTREIVRARERVALKEAERVIQLQRVIHAIAIPPITETLVREAPPIVEPPPKDHSRRPRPARLIYEDIFRRLRRRPRKPRVPARPARPRYSPSFEAIVFGITAPKEPPLVKVFAPTELRPIIVPPKRRKKKKKKKKRRRRDMTGLFAPIKL